MYQPSMLSGLRLWALLLWIAAASQPVWVLASDNATSAQPPSVPHGWIEAIEEIDRLVESSLRENGLEPLPIIDDEQFVRRVYLDLVGRIPSLQEVRDFLESPAVDKRSQLVNRLIHSRGYQSHQYNFWADILRVRDMDAGINRVFYVLWLRDALAENKPYDGFVRELLTASGASWQRGNGAVGYYLRDRGMPLDNIANSMQVFLGTRVACAQCHDHPREPWTRRQFYELAAYTHGVVTDNTASPVFGDIYRRERGTSDEELRAFSQYMRNTFYRDQVVGAGVGEMPLPADYQYADDNPGDKVQAHALFEPLQESGDEAKGDARQQFADWVTSPENPRFTKVIVNRLWKRAMGRGLIEPVDDIPDDEDVQQAELLECLVRLMVRMNYDLRAFQQVLFLTKTYQRDCVEKEPDFDGSSTFQGRLLSRMTAEQVWDSLLTLAVADVDHIESVFFVPEIYYQKYRVLVGQKTMYDRFEEIKDLDAEQYWAYIQRELQAMKNDLSSQGIEVDEAVLAAGVRPWPDYANYLMRASELRSPELPGHFLRIFGQSNREFIDASSKSVSVVQLLAMFNGFVDQRLLGKPDSVLLQAMNNSQSVDEKLDVAFLAILGRRPSATEREIISKQLDLQSSSGQHDLVWSLTNSQEFLFIR